MYFERATDIVLLTTLALCLQCSGRDEKTHSADMPGDQSLMLTGKKILFVDGGWEGHHPEACRDLYVPWLKSVGAEVVVSNSLDAYADSSLMQSLDLIIQTSTMGEISETQLRGLLTAVRNDTGFAGWHGGIVDAFRGTPDYHFMTGGQFVAHPGDLIDYTVHVTKPNDPVMQGVKDFTVHTEQYYMHFDPSVDVLATTEFSGEHVAWLKGVVMPVIWKKTYGKGRVFFNAIGHRMEDHHVPEFETTMKRGILWACR